MEGVVSSGVYCPYMGFIVPDVVATHFHVRFGDRVADLGAGSGHFTRALSRLVGPEGKVFAVEIQKQLTEAIAQMARTEHLSNVEPIWGDLESLGGTKISDGTLDAAVLSNTLSMLEDKATAFKECARILRKGGKLLIIDWADSFKGMGPAQHLVVPESVAKELPLPAGFVFERAFGGGEHHYGLSFRRT